MQFQTAYENKRKVALSFLDEDGNPLPSKTQQQFKDETNIYTILKKADKTGLITHVNSMRAQYGDFTEVNEYQQNLNMVMEAQESFMALPAKVRKRFGNDPGEFLEFASNPENIEEMRKLGLAPEAVVLPPDPPKEPAQAPEPAG
jgi:phage internal scaffolding protein